MLRRSATGGCVTQRTAATAGRSVTTGTRLAVPPRPSASAASADLLAEHVDSAQIVRPETGDASAVVIPGARAGTRLAEGFVAEFVREVGAGPTVGCVVRKAFFHAFLERLLGTSPSVRSAGWGVGGATAAVDADSVVGVGSPSTAHGRQNQHDGCTETTIGSHASTATVAIVRGNPGPVKRRDHG